MKITRIKVTNYRGIEALDTKVSAAGVIASGKNGAGKTSLLGAIRCALAARDVSPDAIRIGADRAEILIDVDDLSVRRAISPTGTSLSVTTTRGGAKAKVTAPQAFLTELLGTAALDPLELFLAKPRDRRALVLAALPVTVTHDRIAKWVPETHHRTMADSVDVENMHGLDAVSAVHRKFYDARAAVNATAKELAGRVARDGAAIEADEATTKGAPALDAAKLTLDSHRMNVSELRNRARRVDEQGAKFAATRTKIAELREVAADAAEQPPGPTIEEHNAAHDEARRLRLASDEAEMRAKALANALREAEHARKVFADSTRQADELEATIAAASETAPTAADIGAAQDAVTAAERGVDLAVRADAVRKERAALTKDADALAKVQAEAADLTAIVDRLRVDAPRELIAEAKGIPGLGIDGDALTLDGVSLDALSGREQMRFAVQVARRANAASKILVVDGLERLDPDQLAEFVREATAGEWQLLATKVDRGEIVLSAIEPDEAEAAAQ